MAATSPMLNGTQSPPSEKPLSSAAKRKRNDVESQATSPTISPSPQKINGIHAATPSEANIQEIIYNIWKVLESHDTSPAVLQHPTKTPFHRNIANGDEPITKRTKLTSPSSTAITAKVQDGSYTSIEQFQADVETVCTELVSEIGDRKNDFHGEHAATYLKQDRQIAELSAFRSFAASLVRRESIRQRMHLPNGSFADKATPVEQPQLNGVRPSEDLIQPDDHDRPGRTVLTLFGNAQGHKQLFSSFQKALSKPEEPATEQSKDFSFNASIKPVLNLRESGLPNGISSTKILYGPTEDAAARNKPHAFLDVFAPPSTLPPLIPPKTPRPPLSRQSSITWKESNLGIPRNPLVHTQQRLVTGHWLGYDGVALAHEPSSPEVKRKQRDRTLSTGEVPSILSDAILAAQNQAKEEASFRSLYSSFAPCRDNSLAIFPEETKSQLWWQKVGRHHFDQVSAHPLMRNAEESSMEEDLDLDNEEAVFKKAVDDFEPELLALDPRLQCTPSEGSSCNDLMEEISELLETLHSYQRIRNSCLNSTIRPSARRSSSLHDVMGTPSIPSNAEIETYNVLKAQLVLIISMLPPHAVAKLNGEQLEELNISSYLQLEEKTYRGVMDEDYALRTAKTAAHDVMSGSGSLQSRPDTTSTPSSLVSGQARTAQMGAQSRSAMPPQYYGGAPSSVSRQTSSFSRQPLSAWQTPTQTYNATGPRGGPFSTQQSFGQQQTPRQSSGSVRPPMQQIPSGRPQAQQSNGLYSTTTPSQPAYQQRAQNYASNTSSFNLKNSYNAHHQNATPNRNLGSSPPQPQSQYTRHAYPPPKPVFPMSGGSTPLLGTTGNAPRLETPVGIAINAGQSNLTTGTQIKQSESPAPAQTALAVGRSVSGTPQPKQEG